MSQNLQYLPYLFFLWITIPIYHSPLTEGLIRFFRLAARHNFPCPPVRFPRSVCRLSGSNSTIDLCQASRPQVFPVRRRRGATLALSPRSRLALSSVYSNFLAYFSYFMTLSVSNLYPIWILMNSQEENRHTGNSLPSLWTWFLTF